MKFSISESDKNKTGVYCITNNINGKIYIGSTSNSFYNRYHQHISDYKKGKHNGLLLKRAFDKHKIDNFEFSLVCISCGHEILKMEQFYIDKGADYNCALIAGSLLGLKHNPLSKTRTIKGGNHHSAIKVDKYTKEGIFLKSYDCVLDAQKENGIKSASNIMQSCKGIVFSAGGYRWSLKGSDLKDRDNRLGKHKIIIKNEKMEKQFNSQTECAVFFCSLGYKTKQGSISNSVRLNQKLYGFTIIKLN